MTGYGVPSAQPPAAQRPDDQQFPLFDVIGAGLAVLSFIWGFLDWYGAGGDTLKGYGVQSAGAAAIGLSLLAGGVAAAPLLDRALKPSLIPSAAAIAAFLVTLGMLVGKQNGVDVKVGLILTLITTIVQAALFIVGWLQLQGKINVGGGVGRGRQATQPTQQWGPPPQQQYGGYPGGPSGYGQPTQHGHPQATPQHAQPSYAPPQQPSYAPPQQPSYNPAQPGYGQPQQGQPQHGQPQHGQPQHGQPQPGQPGQPPAGPQQPGYGGQQQGNPFGGQHQA